MRSPAPSQGGWTNGGGASVGGTHGPHGVAGGAGAGAGAAARLDHVTTVYAEAVRRMAESRRPGGHVDYSVASAFKEVAKSLTKGATVSSQVLKPWDLIIMMMHESSADASGVLGNADRAENERILAAGAARFLERSSEEHMRNKLNRKRAGVGGELGLLTLVRAWIDQRASSNSSRWASWYRTSTPQVDGMPLWPQVFYCLRCGGRREALELLRAAAKDAALPRTLVAAMEAVTHALSLQVSERGGAADAAPAIAAVNQRFEEVDRVRLLWLQRRPGGVSELTHVCVSSCSPHVSTCRVASAGQREWHRACGSLPTGGVQPAGLWRSAEADVIPGGVPLRPGLRVAGVWLCVCVCVCVCGDARLWTSRSSPTKTSLTSTTRSGRCSTAAKGRLSSWRCWRACGGLTSTCSPTR